MMRDTRPPVIRPTVLLILAGMIALAGGVTLMGVQSANDALLSGGLHLCSTVVGAAATVVLTLTKDD